MNTIKANRFTDHLKRCVKAGVILMAVITVSTGAWGFISQDTQLQQIATHSFDILITMWLLTALVFGHRGVVVNEVITLKEEETGRIIQRPIEVEVVEKTNDQ